ncbi:MAG: L-threonylcarbamoyladenylate synthase [Sedimentisphaerales bacterium]|jgi:protein-tyrosine phosphatase|nr:L-threonylcarbamoyladenylate synthase [Sedimentisphaerales bacterium]
MRTKVLDLSKCDDLQAAIAEAAAIVEAGGLVAFPTETVYGLACRVRADCLERLDLVKGRPSDKRYTLHIGDRASLRNYLPHLPLKARKLIDKAWPGPLTAVFELEPQILEQQQARLGKEVFDLLYRDYSIGIRCPDHAIASALLRQTACPVVAPSANPTGLPAPSDAQAVLSYLDGQIDLVLDGGPCRYGQSSTVARIGARGIEVLREGAYTAGQLQTWSSVTILFVCTGNTCRSAIAEGLCKAYLAKRLGCEVDQLAIMGYSVMSAGVMDLAGMTASNGAKAACAARGVDISGHKSQALTESVIQASDLIFVMDQSHRRAVLDLEPTAADRCLLLDDKGPIPDPIGQSAEVFERCATQIEAAIERRIRELVL